MYLRGDKQDTPCHRTRRVRLPGVLLAVFLLAVVAEGFAGAKPVRIGVQAHRAESLKLWSPTADYLTNSRRK